MKSPSPRTDSGTPNLPPAVSVIVIYDPTAVGESIEEIKQSAVQLESSPLRVRPVIVRLGASVVLFQSTNRAVRTRTVVQEGVVAFVAVATLSHFCDRDVCRAISTSPVAVSVLQSCHNFTAGVSK